MMVITVLLPLASGLADPTGTYMSEIPEEFRLRYEIEEVQILEAELWKCYSSHCESFGIHTSGNRTGDREITCSDAICSALVAYVLFGGGFQRLRIEFTDRVRLSNPFRVDYWNPAEFTVLVREHDLLVRPNYLISPLSQIFFFIPLLGITLATEIGAGTYIANRKRLPRILGRIAVANLITLPIVWFLIPGLQLSVALTVVLAEAFAVSFEALLLRFSHLGIDGRSSLVLSLGMNGASFLLGLAIFGIVSIL